MRFLFFSFPVSIFKVNSDVVATVILRAFRALGQEIHVTWAHHGCDGVAFTQSKGFLLSVECRRNMFNLF